MRILLSDFVEFKSDVIIVPMRPISVICRILDSNFIITSTNMLRTFRFLGNTPHRYLRIEKKSIEIKDINSENKIKSMRQASSNGLALAVVGYEFQKELGILRKSFESGNVFIYYPNKCQ